VDDDHHASAVRDQDDRSVDRRELVVQRVDARPAAELVVLERRYGARARMCCLQVRLSVLRHMIAQTGNDQDGGASVWTHRILLLPSGLLPVADPDGETPGTVAACARGCFADHAGHLANHDRCAGPSRRGVTICQGPVVQCEAVTRAFP